jgi:hypothetical protein
MRPVCRAPNPSSIGVRHRKANPEREESNLGPGHRLVSRTPHGAAVGIGELALSDQGWGRDFAAAVGGEAEDIIGAALRRIGPGTRLDVVRRAVVDVIERRRFSW